MTTKTSFFHNKSFCNSYSFSTIIADCVRIFGLQQDWQKLIIFYIGSAKSEASVNFCGWFLFASKVTCILHHNHENLATINKDLQNLKIHKILSQSNWIEEYRHVQIQIQYKYKYKYNRHNPKYNWHNPNTIDIIQIQLTYSNYNWHNYFWHNFLAQGGEGWIIGNTFPAII